MYGQFQNSVASAAKWVFLGFVVIVLGAILLGGNIKDATWLNPGIASAQAEKIQVEAAHQQEMNKLQEQLATAQTEAEIQAIQREEKRLNAQFEYDMQILVQKLVNRQRWTDAAITLVIFAGGAISIAIIVLSVAWVISKNFPKPSQNQTVKRPIAQTSDKEKDEVKKYWQERRQWARDNEEWFRSVALLEARLKTAAAPKSANNEQRDNLPLAI